MQSDEDGGVHGARSDEDEGILHPAQNDSIRV